MMGMSTKARYLHELPGAPGFCHMICFFRGGEVAGLLCCSRQRSGWVAQAPEADRGAGVGGTGIRAVAIILGTAPAAHNDVV